MQKGQVLAFGLEDVTAYGGALAVYLSSKQLVVTRIFKEHVKVSSLVWSTGISVLEFTITRTGTYKLSAQHSNGKEGARSCPCNR